MIAFDLACNCGVIFEGWFQSHEDYSNQQCGELIVCPECGGNKVKKILSPIRIQSNFESSEDLPSRLNEKEVSPEMAEKALQVIQKYVEKNFEDVGTKFTEESLKIHFGVEEPRNIRGFATEEEETLLKNEGINLLKIPLPPKNDDMN